MKQYPSTYISSILKQVEIFDRLWLLYFRSWPKFNAHTPACTCTYIFIHMQYKNIHPIQDACLAEKTHHSQMPWQNRQSAWGCVHRSLCSAVAGYTCRVYMDEISEIKNLLYEWAERITVRGRGVRKRMPPVEILTIIRCGPWHERRPGYFWS